MLSKLIRYEWKAVARVCIPMYGGLILAAMLTHFLLGNLERFSSTLYDIITMAMSTLCFGLFMAAFVLTLIIQIQRFSKNLLGDEGYLMFTLPASVSQHITAKLVVAVLLDVLSVAAAILAVLALAIVLTGVGVALTVNMRLVPNPGDGIVQAVAQRMGRDQGFAKNVFDLGCVAATVCLGLLLTGRIVGIGLGTLLAMVGVGRVIALVNHWTKAGMSRLAGVA